MAATCRASTAARTGVVRPGPAGWRATSRDSGLLRELGRLGLDRGPYHSLGTELNLIIFYS